MYLFVTFKTDKLFVFFLYSILFLLIYLFIHFLYLILLLFHELILSVTDSSPPPRSYMELDYLIDEWNG